MKFRHNFKWKLGTAALALALAAASSWLPGARAAAASGDQAAEETCAETEETQADDQKEAKTPAESGDEKKDKTETVTAKADARGKVTKITSEVTLKNPGGDQPIEDISTLTGIKNTTGDESFTQEAGGRIIWENHGEDIRYEGTGEQALPVNVTISYYLDGAQISPEDLAGRDGDLKIRFDYENKENHEVTVKGRKVSAAAPYAAVTTMFLPEEHFSDIHVENGRAVEMDEQTIIIGYAMPGLADSLKLSDFEPTEEMEIPDFVEVTASVTDFELDFTATVITGGLFSEIEDEDLKDGDDLADHMKELTDASGELVDATAEMAKGAGTFGDYLAQYTEGVSAVSSGAAQLSDGMAQLNEKKTALSDGARQLSAGLSQLDSQLKNFNLDGGSQIDMAGAEKAMKALAADAQTLGGALTQIQSAMAGLSSLEEALTSYQTEAGTQIGTAAQALAQVDLSGADAAADSQAKAQAREAAEAAVLDALAGTDLSEEEKASVCSQVADAVENSISVSGVTGDAQTRVETAKTALASMPEAELPQISIDPSVMETISGAASDMQTQLQTLGSLAEGLSGMGEQMAGAGQALEELKKGVSQLAQGSQGLSEGIDAYNEAIGQLCTGMSGLNDGAAQLGSAGTELKDGYSALAEGSEKLHDGFAEFDKEGIQELGKLAGDDLTALLDRVRALHQIDAESGCYSGLAEGRTGSVRYIIETDEIK